MIYKLNFKTWAHMLMLRNAGSLKERDLFEEKDT